MKTIEITAEVQADGKLTVQFPPGIEPGYHRIVLVIDEATTTMGQMITNFDQNKMDAMMAITKLSDAQRIQQKTKLELRRADERDRENVGKLLTSINDITFGQAKKSSEATRSLLSQDKMDAQMKVPDRQRISQEIAINQEVDRLTTKIAPFFQNFSLNPQIHRANITRIDEVILLLEELLIEAESYPKTLSRIEMIIDDIKKARSTLARTVSSDWG